MVREWTRQAARATGVSLLAPLVLLLAAAAVASGGGLGALDQVAGGPALPDLGTPAPAPETLADAEIVGADTSEPPASSGAAAAGGTGPLASAPGGAGGATPGGNDPVNVSPLPPLEAPDTPNGAAQQPVTPAPSPGGGAPAAPVDDVIENTRGIGESLPGPLGPTTGDILDLLLPRGSR